MVDRSENSVNTDVAAYNELPHLGLHCFSQTVDFSI